MKDKQISVIIPCYNHERYIRKAVMSILEQTYRNIEVLVADDCSLDNSPAILMDIHDPRLKIFLFKENRGTVNTLNFLLKKASGDYIATLGSDDYFAPDKLEKQLRVMEENPELGAVFTTAEIIDENGQLYTSGETITLSVFDVENRTQAQWLRYLFEDGNHFCHSSALIRREVQEEIGLYHPAYRQLHDFDLWLRLLCRYPIYVIPEKLTFYRRQNQGNSVSVSSSANTIRLFNEYSLIFYRLFKNLDKELFMAAFGDQLEGIPSETFDTVYAKYHVLRNLGFVGCSIRSSAQMLFMECLDVWETEEYSPELQDLLHHVYTDSAKFAVEYPVGEEALEYLLPNLANHYKNVMNALAAEKDAVIAEKDAIIAERDALVEEKRSILTERHEMNLQYAALTQENAALVHETNRLSRDAQILNIHVNNLQQELNAVYTSTSWKVTKPLRKVVTVIKKIFYRK